MKYALVSRPGTPPGRLSAGIGWASADHAVCVVDAAGEMVSVEHSAEGLRDLVQRLARVGRCRPRLSVWRRPGRGRPAGGGRDRGGDHLASGEELAVAVWVGGQQR
jgi:hypothetical protein